MHPGASLTVGFTDLGITTPKVIVRPYINKLVQPELRSGSFYCTVDAAQRVVLVGQRAHCKLKACQV